MSSPVTETDTFPSSVTAPDVNDTTYPSVVRTLTTSLASRTRYHENTFSGATSATEQRLPFTAYGSFPTATAQLHNITTPTSGRADGLRESLLGLHRMIRWTQDRVLGAGSNDHTFTWVPSITAGAPDGGGYWGVATPTPSGSYAPHIVQTTATAREVGLSLPVLVPGLYLKTITARVASTVSHGGSLPAVMPLLGLNAFTTVASFAAVATQVDTTASAAAYEAEHTIVLSANVLLVSGTVYALMLRGESGANAQDNSFRVYSLTATIGYA